jgi:hypothetical protein
MPGRAADLAVLPALEVLVRAPSIPEKILPAIVEGGWLSSATLLERLKDTQLLSYARVVLQLAIHHIEQALAAPWLLESLGFVLMALPHSLYGAIQAPLIEAQKLPKFTGQNCIANNQRPSSAASFPT